MQWLNIYYTHSEVKFCSQKIHLFQSFSLGIKGLMLNVDLWPIPGIKFMIDNRQSVVKVTPLGEFWRLLLPGICNLKVVK